MLLLERRINRSQNAFALGARNGVSRMLKPIASNEKGAQTGDETLCGALVWSTLAAAIEDAQLMFDEQRLGNDGTEATRPCKPHNGGNQMNEKDNASMPPCSASPAVDVDGVDKNNGMSPSARVG